jgi:protoporphyrin/coproporphyrin ferrochelatase
LSPVPTGVVLMTYGSPRDLDDVAPYLSRIRGGREPSADVVAEFRRRYATIGMSPLIAITDQQARALEAILGDEFRVVAGMRFSAPTIGAAVQSLRASGVERVLGLILSPQYSPLLMGGYVTALQEAADSVPVRCVQAWHLNPAFIDVMASRIRAALARFSDEQRDRVPVLLTAHSLPRRIVDREPDYVAQLEATAHAIAARAELTAEQWSFAYQSAGHTPEEWLKPDLLDVLPELARAGQRAVVVAPVQFLADHLETLYDVDVAGRAEAAAAGITTFVRTDAPNATPDFIAALANVVRGEVAAWHQRRIHVAGAPA